MNGGRRRLFIVGKKVGRKWQLGKPAAKWYANVHNQCRWIGKLPWAGIAGNLEKSGGKPALANFVQRGPGGFWVDKAGGKWPPSSKNNR